ncbi:AAA family ATPase [Flagellimonas lutimaris]|uniref:McrB family protein n=1 Tax=Flagellimonas lutimaris TaxID=475082 RepID=UPI003F5CCD1A
MEYREKHPHFNFLMRQRAGAGQRFESGHWFQGNDDYAFVGLINASGGSNRTRSVGILFYPNDNGYTCNLEVVYNEEKDENLIAAYQALIHRIGPFQKITETKSSLHIGEVSKDNFSTLFTFLDRNYQSIAQEFRNQGKENVLVSNKKFDSMLSRINEVKAAISSKTQTNIPAYYCVGITFKDGDNENQLSRFKKENIWENGYGDKNIQIVKRVKPGSMIAAKTTYTEGKNGSTVSVLKIHAIGKVVANPGDGNILKVKWEDNLNPFVLYGKGGYRSTISQIRNQETIDLIFKVRKGNSPDELDKLNINEMALNQILYGPPGTGKTYSTKELAVQIANPALSIKKDLDNVQKRELILSEYDRLCEAGQIVFTTFHQSFGYEDFVEGIKPVTTADQKLIYDIKPGIFKKVCKKAEDNYLDFKKGGANEMAFDDAFEKLKEEWEENEEIKFPLKREGYDFTIIGFTEKSIQFKKSSGGTDHTLSISTLRDAYYGTREINETGVGIYYPSILKRLKSYESENDSSKKSVRNYVLIIDEINRGNVSSIFGELITLLEPDKRLGADEEILLKLPYSKDETFGVPPNLYIVGTMNTADRSVEALDTALRRRFIFEEVMPKPQLLEKITYDGFNLKEVLETINERIEALLDRDHTIGHSYFIKLKSGDKDGLSRVFKNNIIPLLQEYFYNDYEKIALVLGQGFVKEKGTGKVNFAQVKNIDVPESEATYILLPQIDDIEAAVGGLLNTSNE